MVHHHNRILNFSSIHTLLLSIYLFCLIFIFFHPHTSPFKLSNLPYLHFLPSTLFSFPFILLALSLFSSIHTLLLSIYLTCLSLFSSIHTLLLSIYLTCLIFIFFYPHSSPLYLSYLPIFIFFHPHSSPLYLSYLPIFIFFHQPLLLSIYLTCLIFIFFHPPLLLSI